MVVLTDDTGRSDAILKVMSSENVNLFCNSGEFLSPQDMLFKLLVSFLQNKGKWRINCKIF